MRMPRLTRSYGVIFTVVLAVLAITCTSKPTATSAPDASAASDPTVPAFLVGKTRFILFSNALSSKVAHNQAPSKQFLEPVPKAIRIIPGGGLRIQNYLEQPQILSESNFYLFRQNYWRYY